MLKPTREGSDNQAELEAAELAVIRVLDGNRTLESAAFSGGRTALHHAAVRGDHALVRLLLERGCKPHAKVRVLYDVLPILRGANSHARSIFNSSTSMKKQLMNQADSENASLGWCNGFRLNANPRTATIDVVLLEQHIGD